MDVEARARLESVLSVIEHETEALEALRDVRLSDALRAMAALRTEIARATCDRCSGRRSLHVMRKAW